MCREVMEKVGGMDIATSNTMAIGIISSICRSLNFENLFQPWWRRWT